MSHGTVGWVQVGTDDPASAKRFYGGLFDWTFAGETYEYITYQGAEQPHGGIFDTDGKSPNHAIFMVIVDDVAAAAEQAERLGGKTLVPPTTTPAGLTFAHLLDPAGNEFGVYKPA
jgi:predicted enzyme related to lactoylglutathione lyase